MGGAQRVSGVGDPVETLSRTGRGPAARAVSPVGPRTDPAAVAADGASTGSEHGTTTAPKRAPETGLERIARRGFERPSLFSHRGAGITQSTSTLDLLVILFCFASVHIVYLGDLNVSSHRVVVLISALLFLMLAFQAGNLYRRDHPRALHEELGRLAVCWALALAGIGLFAFLSKTAEDVSRVWVGGSMTLSLLSLGAVRVVRTLFITTAEKDNAVDVVLVGAGENAALALDRIEKNTWSGKQVVAVFDDRGSGAAGPRVERNARLRIDGPIERLYAFVEARRRAGVPVGEVWISLPLSRQSAIDEIVERLRDSSVDVCLIPDAFGLRLLSGAVTRIGEMRVVNVSEIALPPRAELVKQLFDYGVAGIAIVLLAVPMALIALAVRLESPGPALFRQQRYGVDGREIEVWKFRSMRTHADSDVRQATRDDVRVTRVGRFIRRTSLDELPQFLNVLQGTMSIVGPRPHAVVHNESWRSQISGYMLRHKIKPGITGWAQVNGWRGETDTFEKMERRVHFDLEYIRNWSLWLDIKIVLLTVVRGFSGKDVY